MDKGMKTNVKIGNKFMNITSTYPDICVLESWERGAWRFRTSSISCQLMSKQLTDPASQNLTTPLALRITCMCPRESRKPFTWPPFSGTSSLEQVLRSHFLLTPQHLLLARRRRKSNPRNLSVKLIKLKQGFGLFWKQPKRKWRKKIFYRIFLEAVATKWM